MDVWAIERDRGSSPLVRGGRTLRPDRTDDRGLIPARAGRTACHLSRSRPRRAHPRSCGADHRPRLGPRHGAGSSPLVRGGQCFRCPPGPLAGLIPARAGRTLQRRAHRRPCQAHPRSCGADHAQARNPGTPLGSSPLVRGGLSDEDLMLSPEGLIPARAGRTCHPRRRPMRSGAHPRSCGADALCQTAFAPAQGSSPLVRGGPSRWRGGPGERRLIPARAGRTSPSPQRSGQPQAHPRSCGADPLNPPLRRVLPGSSPLVRGGLLRAGLFGWRKGLIPARAGRTERQ